MEMAADHGVIWRREFINLVQESGLKIDCIDPTNKPCGLSIGEDKEYQQQLQKSGKFKQLQDYVHRYRRYDLRFVDYCDFIVVAVTPEIAQWGTANELYFAEMQHKPRFIICKGGLYNLPRWLFDVIKIDDRNTSPEIFESPADLTKYLTELNSGTIPLDEKWVLIRKNIELSRKNLELSQTKPSFFKRLKSFSFRQLL